MAWRPLADRLPTLPLVLAGPIVRRTDPDEVTVWLATKESCAVTLRVYASDGGGPPVERMLGSRFTVELGPHLHLVAVTARAVTQEQRLAWGSLYFYDLFFQRLPAGVNRGETPPAPVPTTGDHLATPGVIDSADGSYRLGGLQCGPLPLPSFVLPPPDVTQLRIVHGSCRKPHGPGRDAFDALDQIIGAEPANPLRRPHQLFLTGDQIYADDVAAVMLYMLRDAATTLLGWTENLPGISPAQLAPGQRAGLARAAGFTTTHGSSHLITFGEFCAMYLFVWSDVLWPSPAPTPDETIGRIANPRDRWDEGENARRLETFRQTLGRARTSLANVSTYMIFDDHEVTDDWYMNLLWCEQVLPNPLGRRIVRNGLTAYGLFQGWGNDPEQFRGGGEERPGARLLRLVSEWGATRGADGPAAQQLDSVLPVPELTAVRVGRSLPHPPGSINWHYHVPGPQHEALVMDTRTWRAFPGASNIDFVRVVSLAGLRAQLLNAPPAAPATHVTVLVLAAPLLGVPPMEAGQELTTWVPGRMDAQHRFGADTEGFGLEKGGFELLLGHVAGRARQVVVDGVPTRRGRVVVLSGDVHFGYSARLEFWGDHLAGVGPQRAELVFAALTSSSLKHLNTGGASSVSLHRSGYDALRNLLQALRGTDAHIWLPWGQSPPGGVFVCGWSNPSRQRVQYTVYQEIRHVSIPVRVSTAPDDPAVSRDFSDADATHATGHAERAPDWRYRVDFIVGDPEPRDRLPRHGLPTGPASPRDVALRRYVDHAANQADYVRFGAGQQIVGFNNLGLVTFLRFASPVGGVVDDVRHELWWQMERRGGGQLPFFPLTRYTVSLRLDDTNYPRRVVIAGRP